MAELSFNVVQGMRPTRPGNALTIGFSDSLWRFAQRCWDEDMGLRPNVAEVVTQLNAAAAAWNRVMPPSVETENVISAPEESMSDSMEHCEFEILILS